MALRVFGHNEDQEDYEMGLRVAEKRATEKAAQEELAKQQVVLEALCSSYGRVMP